MISWLVSFLLTHLEALTHGCVDKYAADLGYSSALVGAHKKKQAADGVGDVDVMFSIYHNPVPTVSNRLSTLEKLEEEKLQNKWG